MFADPPPVVGIINSLEEQSSGIHCCRRSFSTSIILCSCGKVSG